MNRTRSRTRRSKDVRALLRQLAVIDQRAAVWCACQCARTVLHLLPAWAGQTSRALSPPDAIDLAEDWAQGRVPQAACWDAADEFRRRALVLGAAPAALVVRAAAVADPDDPDVAAEIGGIVASAATAAASAIGRHAGEAASGPRHLVRLSALISAVDWPLTVPTPSQRLAAPPAAQVAWDLVAADARSDHAIPALVRAHARAGRLHLDWADPAQRAVAERATDEETLRRVAEVLGGSLFPEAPP